MFIVLASSKPGLDIPHPIESQEVHVLALNGPKSSSDEANIERADVLEIGDSSA